MALKHSGTDRQVYTDRVKKEVRGGEVDMPQRLTLSSGGVGDLWTASGSASGSGLGSFGGGSGDGSLTGSGDGSLTGSGDGSLTGSGDGSLTGSGDGSLTGSGDGSLTCRELHIPLNQPYEHVPLLRQKIQKGKRTLCKRP